MKTLVVVVILLLTVSVVGAEKGSAAAATVPSQAVPQKNGRFSGTVEIYVTEWCGYCKRALNYLRNRGIPYVAYDIEKDAAALQRYRELGGRGVPLIKVGSRVMPGFSPELLESYLDSGSQ